MAKDTNLNTVEGIMMAQAAGEISLDDAVVLMKELKSRTGGNLSVKHGSQGKGNVSLYGLQSRFPVTLYPDQWERLISEGIPAIQKFLKEEKANLANKKFLEKYAKEKAAERAAKEKD